MTTPTTATVTTRLVGIDFGTKRIGLSKSDPLRMFAQPIGTVSPKEVWDVLAQLDTQEGVEAFVVGMPFDLDDTIGESARTVLKFIDKLHTTFPHIPIIQQDERFTSEIAKMHILVNTPKKKARQDKRRVDAVAATLILQDYLNGI